MHAVELQGVRKDYGSRTGLHEVDLVLEPGSAVGLLGPNGAGKTTALRLILGFILPSAGRILVHGIEPSGIEARRGLGYLPEQVQLPSRMNARAFLRLHARLIGLRAKDAAEEEIEAIARLVGIEERLDDRLGTLSKGLSQRVGFAQALLGRPDLLLLDEPTSGLDPIGMRAAREWIDQARSWGTTVLMSSHVLSEVERCCDRVVILNEGRMVAAGTLESILHEGEELEDAFVRLVASGGGA